MTFLGRYNKSVFALIGAALLWGITVLKSKDASITPEEWANLLQGAGIAVGVWTISNDGRPVDPGVVTLEGGASVVVTESNAEPAA